MRHFVVCSHLPAPSGCCGRLLSCCSDGDTYCVLLRDIESVFASEIKNAYYIAFAIFFLLLIVPTFLFFTGIGQFMPWHLALIWLGLALLMFLVCAHRPRDIDFVPAFLCLLSLATDPTAARYER